MTVRAWFTISAIVLVTLTAAVIYRLFAPVPTPEIVARADSVRLGGSRERACWPQRGGDLKCEGPDRAGVTLQKLPRSGRLRFVVTYPVQPEDGTIRVVSRSTGKTVLRSDWRRSLRYDLEPDTYFAVAEARYPRGAFLRYRFAFFNVTASGN